jgi:uncharacterized protein YbjT (DUF2867 family)
VVSFDYGDRTGCETALSGVETLFLVSGSESRDRITQHRTVVDAAAAAGVRQIVYTSFVRATPDATFTLARDHFATEEHIRASGVGYTFLRDNLYLDFVPSIVGEDGVIRGPADDGRAAVVAREDIARVAVEVLRDPPAHLGATYDLTGPQALTFSEMAVLLTKGLRRSIAFHDETPAEAYASREAYGAPGWQVDAWVSTYLAVAAGDLATVTDDVERLTGKPPMSLAQFLARETDHR